MVPSLLRHAGKVQLVFCRPDYFYDCFQIAVFLKVLPVQLCRLIYVTIDVVCHNSL
jgi:hypothetical protein